MALNARTFRFGPYSLDGRRRVLCKGTDVVPIGPKAAEVLACLLSHAGNVVTKEELLARVWPDTFVEEANLSVHVSALRRVFADEPCARIETVARRGYRFQGDVTGDDASPPPRSLAVLPFRALRPGDDHIGVGLADALITRLSGLGDLLVRPTGAVMPYAREPRDPVTAARELGTDMVIEGTWQREAGDLRVSLQLVRASDGASVWATSVVEPFTRLFRVQEALAEQVGHALALHVGGARHALIRKPTTQSGDSYEAYLRGRYFWNKLTPLWLLKARQAFAQAIADDPSFALAHAGIADTDIALAMFGEVSAAEALERARKASSLALQIDDALPEAHTALAFVHAFRDWSAARAREHLRRAIELQPRSAATRQWYALFLAMTGRLIEAMTEIMAAREIDPLSLTVHTTLGLQHYFGGSDEDLAAQRQALDLEPDFALGHWALALAYSLRDDYSRAIASQERAVALTDGCAAMDAVLARFYALAGNGDRARGALGRLENLAHEGRLSPYRVATVWSALGEPDPAFTWLERGLEGRDPWLVWLSVDPMVAELRDDPRCDSLIERVGFSLD